MKKRNATYPRKLKDQPAVSFETMIKATKKGAIHYVGKPGTGGATRALRRKLENLG